MINGRRNILVYDNEEEFNCLEGSRWVGVSEGEWERNVSTKALSVTGLFHMVYLYLLHLFVVLLREDICRENGFVCGILCWV